jgi:hypothetical protein
MVSKSKKFTEINPDTGRTWSRDELWTEKVTLQADVRFLRSQVSRLESDTLTVNDYRKDLTRRAKVVIRELTALFTDLRWTIDQARKILTPLVEFFRLRVYKRSRNIVKACLSSRLYKTFIALN